MSSIPKSYKKHVAEGKGLLIFAIIFAITIRIVYYLFFGPVVAKSTGGYLWEPLSSLLGNSLSSLISSSIIVAGLAIIADHINTKHVFIRRKTLLLPAIIILLFSCHPLFIVMSAEYVSVLLFLLIIAMLFGCYNEEHKQIVAFKVSFILALGSFFTPILLIYIPILWIALVIIRCFNFKSILASLLGIFVLYFPAFSFYLFIDNMETFLNPFKITGSELYSRLYIFDFKIIDWATIVFATILLTIIISDNYLNRHKDKIKIRAYLGVFSFIVIFSVLALLFLNINPLANVFIALITGVFLFSHFFALAERRGTVILFYLSLAFYFLICFSPFLPL